MLQVKSTLCPCLISPQDRTAISSMELISSLHVIYHDPPAAASSSALSFSNPMSTSFRQLSGSLNAKVGKFVSGFIQDKKEQQQHRHEEEKVNEERHHVGPSNQDNRTALDAGLARLVVVDTMNGPALSIQHCDSLQQHSCCCYCSSSMLSSSPDSSRTILIPLYTIGDVSPFDSFTSSSSPFTTSTATTTSSSCCGIYLFAKGTTENQYENIGTAPLRELCRLDLKYRHNNQDLDSTARDEVMEALTLLIQWSDAKGLLQQQQQQQQQQSQQDGGDDSTTGGGIGQRALKIKHFAQREIELAKKKRDRENRKARYLKESGGGLKYTAIAMANREMT